MPAVPIVAILSVFVVPALLVAWIIARVFAHRERLEMIRHGYVPPSDPRDARRAARWADPSFVDPYAADIYGAQRRLRKGVRIAVLGLGLTLAFLFVGVRSYGGSYGGFLGGPSFQLGPWLLGGLIPMFVGLAQVVTALLEGARFGVMAAPPTSGFGASNQPGGFAGEPPRAGSPGAAGWRPGGLSELPKPPQPPKR
ncbi:MAG: DUF6249 domain-containing protein [Vulcanimicrobiaceae bacterium]